ncbi:DUF2946 domain-containing protein [Malikia sp.]|uniref:DUF2946 domain-containing protein n=1 Tax=Malikia sp. TaxID=2070706 RepID=UPI002602157A|nr:DUF2946 domain-containing protein [Malikia sp.]MDD2728215.1 DUF2946 domain-containing protein [Malikia sp.]
MKSKSLVRRWATWLAMWAVVLHALAPGMAQAVLADADPTHEICSSTGIVRLVEPAQDDSGPSGTANSGVHCEWCLLDAALDLPPVAALRFDPLPAAGAPVAVPRAPVVPAPWRLAQPRAPPAFV